MNIEYDWSNVRLMESIWCICMVFGIMWFDTDIISNKF